MGSLGSRCRALLVLSLLTLVYVVFLMTGLISPREQHLQVVEEWQSVAHIGLTPHRQGLLHLDVAIIACYRDRVIHLNIFINYMNSFLLSQNSSARIYVIEQDGKGLFNRAKLFNVGYVEAKRDYNYSCFIFHDIDLIPENPKLIYRCADQPLHLSAYIDRFNYRLPYKSIFGGVSGLSEEQMQKVNGFPNGYWGWGGEDDDLSRRVSKKKYRIDRPPANLARYTMLLFTGKHTRAKPNRGSWAQLKKFEANMVKDGLNNLNYEVIKKVDHKTYIWILADLKHNATLDTATYGKFTTNTTKSNPRKIQTTTTDNKLESNTSTHHLSDITQDYNNPSRGQQPGMLPKASNKRDNTQNSM